MKIKKVIFTYKETRPPKDGEWYINSNGCYVKAIGDFPDLPDAFREIYTREEIVEEWTPKENEGYYYPRIDIPDMYGSNYYLTRNEADQHCLKLGLVFPTKELAIQKAKEILEKL